MRRQPFECAIGLRTNIRESEPTESNPRPNGRQQMATSPNARSRTEISEYTQLQAESREQALQRLIHDAERLGADAVVNIRLTTAMIMQGTAEILAYGTAVKLEKL